MNEDAFTHDVLGKVNTESMWLKIFPAKVFFAGAGGLAGGAMLIMNGFKVVGIPLVILTVAGVFLCIGKTSEANFRKAGGISYVTYILRKIRMKKKNYIYSYSIRKEGSR